MKNKNMHESQKVAIVGFGIEGKAVYDYFKKQTDNPEIHIFDENPGTKIPSDDILHPDLNIPADFNIIYKTPGIPTSKLKLGNPNTKISSLTNIFFEKTIGTIIGVTGTKGKGTITTLINHILTENGFDSVSLGNIGRAGLTLLEEDSVDKFYIYEMSSFQCEHLDKSPHIAVLNNLFPDHLNHHKNFEEYKRAKLKITKFQTQTDYFINASSCHTETKAQQIKIKSLLKPRFETRLLGDYNQMNCTVAYEVAKILGIKDADIRKSIKTYEPLPMRLEKVAEKNDITFYDDSLATIPQATLGSIAALGNINTIILGGSDKGSPLKEFAMKLTEISIKNFIIFPGNGKEMVKYVQDDTNRKIFEVSSMHDAVKTAYENCKGICLLSNAAASFNLFKGYKDKSEQYRYWIKELE
jgi:UDP-N-acetylmuramoylalanine--D-glutamate ligase